jgi:hypothetical protein
MITTPRSMVVVVGVVIVFVLAAFVGVPGMIETGTTFKAGAFREGSGVGIAVGGATITIGGRSATTNSNGFTSYTWSLSPGTYTMTVRCSGYNIWAKDIEVGKWAGVGTVTAIKALLRPGGSTVKDPTPRLPCSEVYGVAKRGGTTQAGDVLTFFLVGHTITRTAITSASGNYYVAMPFGVPLDWRVSHHRNGWSDKNTYFELPDGIVLNVNLN